MPKKLLTAIATEKSPDELLKKIMAYREKSDSLFSKKFFKGRTIFHLLVMHGQYEVLERLLEDETLRTLAYQTDDLKQSLLHLAVLYAHTDNIRHLQWLTDRLPLLINSPDKQGNTPLHLTVCHPVLTPHQKGQVIRCLLRHPSIARLALNNNKQTPRELDVDEELHDALDYVDLTTLSMPRLDGRLPETSRAAADRHAQLFPHLSPAKPTSPSHDLSSSGGTPRSEERRDAPEADLGTTPVSRPDERPSSASHATADRHARRFPHLASERPRSLPREHSPRDLSSSGGTPRSLEASSSSSAMDSLSLSMGEDSSSGGLTPRDSPRPAAPPQPEALLQRALVRYCLQGRGTNAKLRVWVLRERDGLVAIRRAIDYVNGHLHEQFDRGQEEKSRQWQNFACHLVRRDLLAPPVKPLKDPVFSETETSAILSQRLWLISTGRESTEAPRQFTFKKILHQTLGLQLQAELPVLVDLLTNLLQHGDRHQRMTSACMVWLWMHFNPKTTFGRNEAVLTRFLETVQQKLGRHFAKMLDDFRETCRTLEENPCTLRTQELAQWLQEEAFLAKLRPVKAVIRQAMNPTDPSHTDARTWLLHDMRALSRKGIQELTPAELRLGLSLAGPCPEKTPILYLQTAWWQQLSGELALLGLSGNREQLRQTVESITHLTPVLAGAEEGSGPDFHSLMCLSSVLNHQAVSRAVEVHGHLSEKQKAILGEVNTLLSTQKNREHIRRSQQAFPDMLPFIGHLKSDLTFAAEGAPDPVARAEAQGKVLFTLFSLQARLGQEVQTVYTTLATLHLTEAAVEDIYLDRLSHRFKPWPASIYTFPVPPPLPKNFKKNLATLEAALVTLDTLRAEYLAYRLLPPEPFKLVEHIATLMKTFVQKRGSSASDLNVLAKLIPCFHLSLYEVIDVYLANSDMHPPEKRGAESRNPLQLIQMQMTLPELLQSKHAFFRVPSKARKNFPARLRPFFSTDFIPDKPVPSAPAPDAPASSESTPGEPGSSVSESSSRQSLTSQSM